MARLSLRTKILLLIAGTVTGLASIVLIALTVLAGRELDRAVRSDVRATGSVLEQLVRERTQTLENQSLLLARQPVLKAVIGTRDPATVLDTLHEYQAQIHADVTLVTDENGRQLAATDEPLLHRNDRSGEPGIRDALLGRAWTGIVSRHDRLMLMVASPVLDPVSHVVLGTFTAYRAIDSSVASDLKKATGSDIVFLQKHQVVGASLPTPRALPIRPGQSILLTLHGTRYFALYAPLPDTSPQAGMGFVTLRPYDQAMALYYRIQRLFLVVSVGALLLALCAGAAVARGLARPLDGIIRAAQVLQDGGWPERLEVRRTDEIGLLQSAFNEMTAAMRSQQERLLALIDTDPLTELDNHRRFQERLAQEAKRCTHSGEALSLLLIDFDNFQSFNQQQGHAAGDGALREIAQILRRELPEVAILARYEGDEFAALLPQNDLRHAEALAEQVRAVAAQTAQPHRVTLSIGCAEFGTNTTQAEGLALAAELALSRAKQLGRDRVCRFDSVPGADTDADPYQLHRFLKDESLATIQALAAAVDAKDSYTQGHSKSVAYHASQLARYFGLPATEIDLIYTAGTLHDVGKIGVPDAILKKPAQLDDEERRVMETHPVLGEVIVRKAPALASILPGVRHHHERWDGQGYPDRLAGEAIPQMARILAVADTFDAMTSDRPYRKGLQVEVALAEIARGAGTQFDPALAEAFTAMMQAPAEMRRAA